MKPLKVELMEGFEFKFTVSTAEKAIALTIQRRGDELTISTPGKSKSYKLEAESPSPLPIGYESDTKITESFAE